jgi:hypothetical protein
MGSVALAAYTEPPKPVDGGWTDTHQALAEAEGYSDWPSWCVVIQQEKKRLICGARAGRERDRPCAQYVSPDSKSGRCFRHGGHAAKGSDHGNFKNGRYSDYLPEALQRHYERALADPNIVSMADEMALITAREMELREELLDVEHDPGLYRAQWVEIQSVVEVKRRLSEVQRRYLESSEAMISPEERMAELRVIISIIQHHVKDPSVLNAILIDFRSVAEGTYRRSLPGELVVA